MNKSTKAVAYSALSAALGTLLLLLATLLPSGKLVVVCAASLGVVFIECLFGWKWALGTYAVTALLSLLLLPTKALAIYYAALLGYYPLFMVRTERIASKALRFALRLALFNAVMLILYFAARSLLSPDFGTLALYPALLVLALNIGFLLYDCALRQGALYCMRNITRRLK